MNDECRMTNTMVLLSISSIIVIASEAAAERGNLIDFSNPGDISMGLPRRSLRLTPRNDRNYEAWSRFILILFRKKNKAPGKEGCCNAHGEWVREGVTTRSQNHVCYTPCPERDFGPKDRRRTLSSVCFLVKEP
jgi:hypothetical protein